MRGFRHVAMFTWTDEATEEQKRAVADRLAELPGRIPQIRAFDIGSDAGVSTGNHDFVLVADFADRDAYLAYRDDPAHRAVLTECITPILAGRAAVQCELAG